MNAESPGATLARYYDLDLTEDQGDVELYLALAGAHGGDVLELCAGSGRVCVPLAAAGHRVTAVDSDPQMLERAAAHWADAAGTQPGGGREQEADDNLELVMADVRSFRADRRYGLVLLALNSLLLLDDRDAQCEALATMASHLTPDGRAVIDVWLPTPDDLEIYDGRTVLEWVRPDQNGDWVAKTTSARHEPATQRAEVTTFFDAWSEVRPLQRWMRRDRIAFVGAHELAALAERAGLTVETMAGDYELGPFDSDSERVVLVCRVGPSKVRSRG